MKYFFITCIIASFFTTSGIAQSVDSLLYQGKILLYSGNATEATAILEKAAQQYPENVQVKNNLALAYQQAGNMNAATNMLQKLMNSNTADANTYIISASALKQSKDYKKATKQLQKGISKFLENPILFNELGEVYALQKDNKAIEFWEKGIKADPNYAKNYFNAAIFYAYTGNTIKSILYAETALNLDPNNVQNKDLKNILWQGYQNLLFQTNQDKIKNDFYGSIKQAWMNVANATQVNQPLTVEKLISLRTSFLLQNNALITETPYKLFDYQKQLLRDGKFEAYNYQLFDTDATHTEATNWQQLNAEKISDYKKWASNVLYKVPKTQTNF